MHTRLKVAAAVLIALGATHARATGSAATPDIQWCDCTRSKYRQAVDHLAGLLDSGKWDAPEFHARPAVT